ncbi:cyanophycin synthetase, partial [Vibrio parahaemolyticus]|nr:cyanophycin synthetase [Vibrio parahaemolyticus]
VGIQYDYQLTDNGWKWSSGAFELEDLPIPSLPLQNAATALMALGASELQITDINIVNGLNNARLAGRMQVLHHEPEIVLDVAHNPHSAEYLVERVKQQYLGKNIHIVVAMLHDKDIKATIEAITPVATQWYPASLTGPRAATADELCQYLPDGQVHFENPVDAFESARSHAKTGDVILVVGSFH